MEQLDAGKWAHRGFELQSRLWRGLCDEGHLMDEIIGGTGGSMPKSKQYTLKR